MLDQINPGEWAAHHLGVDFYGVHAVFSVNDPEGQIVGAAVLHNRTKYSVDLSYYGPGTMTMGLLRAVAASALDAGFLRVTVQCPASRKRLKRFYSRMGLKFEGKRSDYYGPGKDGVVYAALAPLLLKLASRGR